MYSDEEGVSVQLDEEETKPMDPKTVEEKKKQKRIEKLEKRIKLLQKKKDKTDRPNKKAGKFERESSEIKNKHKR